MLVDVSIGNDCSCLHGRETVCVVLPFDEVHGGFASLLGPRDVGGHTTHYALDPPGRNQSLVVRRRGMRDLMRGMDHGNRSQDWLQRSSAGKVVMTLTWWRSKMSSLPVRRL